MSKKEPVTPYHHGNLRQTLIEIGFAIAKEEGPRALGLRDIARKARVSPSAVYRHFKSRGDLFAAVKVGIQSELVSAIQQEVTSVPQEECTDEESALRQLRAVCRGYVNFALREPGLFRTGFSNDLPQNESIAHLPDEQNKPFILLARPVQQLIAIGYIQPERELLVELAIWSAMHGLALLLLEGPLQELSKQQQQAVISETVEMAIRGIKTSDLAIY